MSRIARLAILGTGLLGGSVGLALRARGFTGQVVGVSRQRRTLEAARARGCIDTIETDPVTAARGSGLIVLATPLGAFPALMRQIAPVLDVHAVVTDVGSTKGSVVAAAREHLGPRMCRFVGAHPMAGSEHQGPEAATADLLAGKPCVLTPQTDADPDAVTRVAALWRGLGMRIIRMTAEEHDRKTAIISHLPHLTSVLLATLARDADAGQIASTGFRDTTRLAGSNPAMRADIVDQNRAAILEAIDRFAASLTALRGRIDNADRGALLDWLEQAKRFRDTWRPDADV